MRSIFSKIMFMPSGLAQKEGLSTFRTMITFEKQPEPKHRPIVQEGAWLFAFGAVHVLRRRVSLHIFRRQIGFNVVRFGSPMKKIELEANMFDSHQVLRNLRSTNHCTSSRSQHQNMDAANCVTSTDKTLAAGFRTV